MISDHAIAVAVSVRTQLNVLFSATNGSSPNTSAFKDPQSTSEPRKSDVQEANIENGVCASQSQAASSDVEEVQIVLLLQT